MYPAAIGTSGGATHDETLRSNLVRYANDLIQEIDQMQRWSYNWSNTSSITTTSGTATYTMPTGMLMVKNAYYVSSSGARMNLTKYETAELSRVYGDPSSSSTPIGIPLRWSLDNRTVTIYPIPNDAGPTSNNYQIFFEGYGTTNPIVETTGTTTASSTTLTIPSTAYLTNLGVSNSATVAIRGAGYPQSATVNDDWVTTATTIAATGTTSTLASAAITAVTTAQAFFNCQPWLITYFPKVMEFGMLREVASYLSAETDYQKWEARYQLELQKARELDLDRTMTLEILATAQGGQKDSQFRRNEQFPGFEVRG